MRIHLKWFTCTLVAMLGMLGVQAQTVTAYRTGTPTEYALNGLPTGTLADADRIVVAGTWTSDNLLLLQKALKTSWTTSNSTKNAVLKSADFSAAAFSGTFGGFGGSYNLFYNCTELTEVVLPSVGHTEEFTLFGMFSGCSKLTTVTNLDKFTKVSSFENAFSYCTALQSITLPEGSSSSSPVSFKLIFNGCKLLTTINNLHNFTKVSDPQSAFNGCSALTHVQFGFDPNNVVAAELRSTFSGTNTACLKYLPAGVTDIPQTWKDAGYTNFVLPITVGTLSPVSMFAGAPIPATAVPSIIADYCYRSDVVWQVCTTDAFASGVTEYALDAAISVTENGKFVRLAVKSLNPDASGAAVVYFSNAVALSVIEAPSTVVTTVEDVVDATDNKISLREAINSASDGNAITFDPTVFATQQTITLNSTLTIDKNLTINGDKKVVLDGGNSGNGATDGVQIMKINSGKTVALNGLTLQHGYSLYTGGAIDNSGTLAVTGCSFRENSARQLGGVVANFGTFTAAECSFIGNSATTNGGGAVYNHENTYFITTNCTFSENTVVDGGGGAVVCNKNANFTAINCTFSGNSATQGGGAVYNTYANFTAISCTFSGNSDPQGGDAVNNNNGTLYMVNNLVVGNGDSQIYGNIAISKYNITTNNVADIFAEVSEGKATLNADGTFHIKNIGAAAWSGTLVAKLTSDNSKYYFKDNGTWKLISDPTQTATESALTIITTDQLGSDRTVGTAAAAGYYTVGAYSVVEATAETPSLVVNTTDDVLNPYDGKISLHDAIDYAGTGSLGNAITFDPTVFATTQTITVGSTLNIDKSLTIDGAGKVILDGNNAVRIMTIVEGKTVELNSLTFQNGKADRGGAIFSKGTLTVQNSTFSGNTVPYEYSAGGAISNYSTGVLTVINSTFSGNAAPVGKGADIYNEGFARLINTVSVDGLYSNSEMHLVHCLYRDCNYNNTLFTTTKSVSGLTAADVFEPTTLNADGTFHIKANGVAAGNGTLVAKHNASLSYYFKDDNEWKSVADQSITANESILTIIGKDQLGNERTTGTAATQYGIYACGAYTVEAVAETPSTIVTTTNDVVNPYDGLISFREAVENYSAEGDAITFTEGNGTQTLSIAVSVKKNITIGDGFELATNDQFNDLFVAPNNTESITFGNVTIKNGNVNMGGGGITIASDKMLKVGETGESWFTSSTFTNNGLVNVAGVWNCSASNFGNVNYSSTGDQTVLPGTYGTLTLSGSGDKTENGNVTADALTVKIGVTFDVNGNLTVNSSVANTSGIKLSGDFTYNGSSASFGSFTYDGGNQTVAVGGYLTLILDGSGIKTLTGNIDVAGPLEINGRTGNIITLDGNNKTLTFTQDGYISADYATIKKVMLANATTVDSWNATDNTNTVDGSGNTNLIINLGGEFSASTEDELIYDETLKNDANITVNYSLCGQNATLNVSTGNTTVYAAGEHAETIGVSAAGYKFAGQSTFDAPLNFTVSPKEVTVSGVTANNKFYNGNADATIDLTNAALSGLVGTETLTLNTNAAIGTFDNANAGKSKTVTITGITLGDGENGGLASNYTLALPITTIANIEKAKIAVPINFVNTAVEVFYDETHQKNFAKATFAWDNVANNSGYWIFFGPDNVYKFVSFQDKDATQYAVTLLDLNVHYCFSIKTKGDGVNYTDSDLLTPYIELTTPKVALAVPDNVTAQRVDNGVEISWDAVANASGYKYRYKDSDATADWTAFSTCQSSASFIITDVIPGHLYEYQVVACGEGIYESSDENAGQHQFKSLATPANLAVTYNGGQITLTWDAASCAETYGVTYQKDGGMKQETEVTANSFSLPFSDFNSCTFSVTAKQSGLCGSFDKWVKSQTAALSVHTLTIDNVNDLVAFRDGINSGAAFSYHSTEVPAGGEGIYFKLSADLDLSSVCSEVLGISWAPIGTADNTFKGTLDGFSHTISNLYINAQYFNKGLFGKMENAKVKDLTLINAYIAGWGTMGVIAGEMSASHISYCHVNGTVEMDENQSREFFGGICGYANNGSTIDYCTVSGSISGSKQAGGICGNINGENSRINGCTNLADVHVDSENVGGIAGIAGDRAVISNCINAGNVTNRQTNKTGGIVGYLSTSMGEPTNTTVISCLNVGNVVSARNSAQGVAYGAVYGGISTSSDVINCYYDKQMCTETQFGYNAANEVTSNRTGSLTDDLTGDALKGIFPGEEWEFAEDLYPVIKQTKGKDAAIVAASPIFVAVTTPSSYETVDAIASDFTYNGTAAWSSKLNLLKIDSGNVSLVKTGYDTITVSYGNASKEIAVRILKPITVSVSGNNTICKGYDVTLTANSDAVAPEYQWYENNSILTGSASQTLTVSPSETSVYKVKVTETHIGAGHYAEAEEAVTVNQPTTGIDVQTACGSFKWIDGNTYTQSTNIPTYNMTNAAGCDSLITLHLTIGSSATIANVVDPSAVCAGGSVALVAPSIADNGISITTEGWEIGGDGSWSEFDPTAALAFADNGKRIRYAATNGCGTSYSNEVTLTVNGVPTISEIIAPSAVCAGGSIAPTAPAVAANGSSFVSEGWELGGDGSWSFFDHAAALAFADNGKSIRYAATNGCGTSYSNEVALTVNDRPTIGMLPSSIEGYAGNAAGIVSPSVAGNGSAITVEGWEIGSSLTWAPFDIATALSLEYNGKHLRYYAANNCGMSYSTEVEIVVSDKLEVADIAAPKEICSGSALPLTAPIVSNPSATGRWEISTDNGTTWQEYLGAVLNENYNGALLRYAASNSKDDVYSNTVSITVNLHPSYLVQMWNDVLVVSNTKEIKFDSWQWYVGGSAVDGQTRQYYYASGSDVPQNIRVMAHTVDGRELMSCPLSSLKKAEAPVLKVFPNPCVVMKPFTLEVLNIDPSMLDGATLTVYSTVGAVVYSQSHVEASNTLQLPQGAYIITVNISGKRLDAKVILQ